MDSLKQQLLEVEACLSSDVVSYYGYISVYSAQKFVELVDILSTNSQSTKLSIFLFSLGGKSDAVNIIKDWVSAKKYQKIQIVIPEYAASTATLLSFIGNKILVDRNNSSFGMIDPQIDGKQRDEPDQSLFEVIQDLGIVYKFNANTTDIEKAFEYELSTNVNAKSAENDFINSILRPVMLTAYDLLIENNLNNNANKESTAIKIITDLMDLSKHDEERHDEKIKPDYLENLGLNIQYYSDNKAQLESITKYHKEMKGIIERDKSWFAKNSATFYCRPLRRCSTFRTPKKGIQS